MKELELKGKEITMQLKLRELETRPVVHTPAPSVKSTELF